MSYYDRFQTVDQVPTGDLNEGDLIFHHGAIMRLGPMKVSQSPEDEGSGPVKYGPGYVLNLGEPGMSIPRGWLQGENRDQWPIQGNNLALWTRVTMKP